MLPTIAHLGTIPIIIPARVSRCGTQPVLEMILEPCPGFQNPAVKLVFRSRIAAARRDVKVGDARATLILTNPKWDEI